MQGSEEGSYYIEDSEPGLSYGHGPLVTAVCGVTPMWKSRVGTSYLPAALGPNSQNHSCIFVYIGRDESIAGA